MDDVDGIEADYRTRRADSGPVCSFAPASSGAPRNGRTLVHYERVGVFVRFQYAVDEFPQDDSFVRGVVTVSETRVTPSQPKPDPRPAPDTRPGSAGVGARPDIGGGGAGGTGPSGVDTKVGGVSDAKVGGIGETRKVTLNWFPREEEDEDWYLIQPAASASVHFSKSGSSPNSNGLDDCTASLNGNISQKSPSPKPDQGMQSKYAFSINLTELREIHRINPGIGWPILVCVKEDGSASEAMEFHNGGVKELLQTLRKFVSLKKDKANTNIIRVTPRTQDLAQSLSALNVSWVEPNQVVHDQLKDPYNATIDSLARVKNYVFDSLLHQKKLKKGQRPPHEQAAIAISDHAAATGVIDRNGATDNFGINPKLEPGYDMITCALVGERPNWVKREPPLTEEQWTQMMDKEGRVINTEQLLQTVFKGGMVEDLRPLLWKYLLGYFNFSLTAEENHLNRKIKEDEYYRMKLQWKTFSSEQIDHFAELREKKALIEKDVIRTDRCDVFFGGDIESNRNLCMLYDVLMTYCMYDFDLGYMQGMSDLLAPILMTMEDEVDAFWCFVGLMKRSAKNFDMDENQGMKLQLIQLKFLLNLLDPSFYAFLEAKESGNLFFAFRWLLINFKREFAFHDICTLWEVLWTNIPTPHFHLFICLAMLDHEKTTIMAKDLDFHEILKHVNELQMKLNVNKILESAEAIYYQVKSAEDKLPDSIQTVLSPPDNDVSRQEKPLDNSQGIVTSPNTFADLYKSVSFTQPSLTVPESDSSFVL